MARQREKGEGAERSPFQRWAAVALGVAAGLLVLSLLIFGADQVINWLLSTTY